MSASASSSGLKPPSVFSDIRNTGAKPKSKLSKLTSPRSSPKKQTTFSPTITEQGSSKALPCQNFECSSPGKSSKKSSPRRLHGGQSEDLQKQLIHCGKNRQQSPSPKHSPRRYQGIQSLEEDFLIQDEMGFGFKGTSDDTGMSFLEFESLYTLEKELTESRRETIAELDEKCIFGGWFGTRRGVYTELPDPSCRNPSTEWMSRGGIVNPGGACGASAMSATTSSIGFGSLQIPTEGFSFAPGWALNAEHYYQWQHRGKSTQQVLRGNRGYLMAHEVLDVLSISAVDSYEKSMWIGIPILIFTDFTQFFHWESMLLDFDFLTEEASSIHRNFLIWYHDKKE